MSAFHCYRVGGVDLACNIEMPELARDVATAGAIPAITIHFAAHDEPAPEAQHWHHGWVNDGSSTPWVRFATAEGGYLLDFPDDAQFALSISGDRVRCFARPGLPEVTMRHLVLDHVLPLAFSLSGAVVLHAGAVAIGQAVIAVAAQSGCGKSTLVAHLTTRGADLLADDCLVVREAGNQWMAYPYYQGLRLSPESISQVLGVEAGGDPVAHYTDKRRVSPSGAAAFRMDPRPLRSIVVLEDAQNSGNCVELAVLSARDAFIALMLDGYFFPTRIVQERRDQFTRLGRLVDTVPAHRLRFPKRFEALYVAGTALIDSLRLDDEAVEANPRALRSTGARNPCVKGE